MSWTAYGAYCTAHRCTAQETDLFRARVDPLPKLSFTMAFGFSAVRASSQDKAAVSPASCAQGSGTYCRADARGDRGRSSRQHRQRHELRLRLACSERSGPGSSLRDVEGSTTRKWPISLPLLSFPGKGLGAWRRVSVNRGGRGRLPCQRARAGPDGEAAMPLGWRQTPQGQSEEMSTRLVDLLWLAPPCSLGRDGALAFRGLGGASGSDAVRRGSSFQAGWALCAPGEPRNPSRQRGTTAAAATDGRGAASSSAQGPRNKPRGSRSPSRHRAHLPAIRRRRSARIVSPDLGDVYLVCRCLPGIWPTGRLGVLATPALGWRPTANALGWDLLPRRRNGAEWARTCG